MTTPPKSATTDSKDSVLDRHVDREFLRYLVCHRIWCALTKQILDVRRAVAVEITMTETGKVLHSVVTADAYDTQWAPNCAELEASGKATVKIYDGRELFG